jgi:TIR domain-containing protein
MAKKFDTGPSVPTHRIFIAYQSAERTLAHGVARHLAAHGIEPVLDKWSFRWGRSLQRQTASLIESCTGFVLL